MPLKTVSSILIVAALGSASFAYAQGYPPRPPADIDSPQGQQYEPYPEDRYPAPGRYPPQQQYPQPQQYPPRGQQPQQYPSQYPPQRRSNPWGDVQSQPLPPPPGAGQPTIRNPQPQPQRQPQPPQQQTQPNTAPPPAQPGRTPNPAQTPPPGQPKATGQQKPPPSPDQPEESEVPLHQAPIPKISNPTAVFSGLDKITGRIITFEAAMDETVQFGALQVTPRACYTRPPTEIQNTTAFVEVNEITLQGDIKRIFTGWMFANSPGLHAVEHPIYDVWVTDCKTTPPAMTASGDKK